MWNKPIDGKKILITSELRANFDNKSTEQLWLWAKEVLIVSDHVFINSASILPNVKGKVTRMFNAKDLIQAFGHIFIRHF